MDEQRTRVPVECVKYAAAIAEAIKQVDETADSGAMQVYVTEVRFGCEGDNLDGVRVTPDEYGGYELTFGGPTVTPGGTQ